MDEISSARVIPFPRRRSEAAAVAAAVPAHPPAMDTPTERLQRALAVLEQAVAAQRTAVGEWRGALQGLRGTVETLRTSLVDYDRELGALRGRVDDVNRNARSLEAWADGALDTARKADQPK